MGRRALERPPGLAVVAGRNRAGHRRLPLHQVQYPGGCAGVAGRLGPRRVRQWRWPFPRLAGAWRRGRTPALALSPGSGSAQAQRPPPRRVRGAVDIRQGVWPVKHRIAISVLTGTVLLCSSPWSAAASLTTATVHWTEDTFGKARPSQPASVSPQPGEFWPGAHMPFSFVYDGKASDVLLGSWTREAASQDSADRSEHSASWTDPATGLKVSASATAFKDLPPNPAPPAARTQCSAGRASFATGISAAAKPAGA